MIPSGTVFIKQIKTIFDEVSEMEFVWQMTKEDWERYMGDHESHDDRICNDWYGAVFFGKLCLEFCHTLDTSAWFPYVNIFEIDKDTGYGYTDQDVAYDLLDSEIVVPIVTTFDDFKREVEERVKEMVVQENLVEQANAPTEADRW